MLSEARDWPTRITVLPDVCNGKPTIRGMRITAQTVLEFLAAGDSAEEILAEYPSLEAEDISACLQAAARVLNYGFITVDLAK